MKRLRLASLACVTVAAAGAALAPAAAAQERSKRDRAGDVRTRGLTLAERRGLDITRVTTDTPAGGLLVRVALRGDFDRVVGRRHLRTALAGVVLYPRSRRADPLAIVSTGAGRREDTVASRGVRGAEVALRDGNEVVFYAPDLDASSIRRVEARTFATRSRRGRARGAQLVGGPVASLLGYFLDSEGADRSSVPVDETEAEEEEREREESCNERRRELGVIERELDRLRSERARAIGDGRRATTRRLEQTIRRYEATQGELEAEISRLCDPPGQAPQPPAPQPQPQPQPGVEGQGSFTFDPNDSFEVFLDFVFSSGYARTAQASGVDAIRVVVPPASDGTARTIIDFLPPPQLPSCALEQQNVMVCQGGSLPYGQATQMKLRTTPAPATGMGGELFGRVGGTFQGPIQITGP